MPSGNLKEPPNNRVIRAAIKLPMAARVNVVPRPFPAPFSECHRCSFVLCRSLGLPVLLYYLFHREQLDNTKMAPLMMVAVLATLSVAGRWEFWGSPARFNQSYDIVRSLFYGCRSTVQSVLWTHLITLNSQQRVRRVQCLFDTMAEAFFVPYEGDTNAMQWLVGLM